MAHDDAAQFIAQAVPWPLAGTEPPEFFVNIHAPMRFKDRLKPSWGGRACLTVREALSFIDYVKQRTSEQQSDDWPKYTGDVYLCMSAQRMAKGKLNKRGRPYYTAVRSDLNALWHKSFFVDVDSKKEYHGEPEATRAAFSRFIHAVGLPFPTFIVSSGSPGNFHAHWVFDERIDSARWLGTSQALVNAMRHHGFKVDYTVTTTPVRVLRIPDTFNYKTDPPNPVLLRHSADSLLSLVAIERILEPYRAMAPPPRALRTSSNGAGLALPSGFGALSARAGQVEELAPNQSESLPLLAELARCCPLVARAVATHGADFPEPLWFETVKLAYHLKEGEAAAHAMSDGYDGYTVEETHEKFETERAKRWPVDRWGWPQCRQIKDAGSDDCNACPWMTAGQTDGRSPLNFIGKTPPGTQIVVATPPPEENVTTLHGEVIPEELVPPGYILKDDIFYKEQEPDEEGVIAPPIPAMPFPTREYRLSEGHWMTFEYFLNKHWRPAIVRCADISDVRSFSRVLGDEAGFVFKGLGAHLARDLMASFVEMLRQRADRIMPIGSNGWEIMDGKEVAWTYGRIRYNCNGNTPSQLPDKQMQDAYAPTGDREPSLRAIKMMHDQGRPVLDAAMALSLGSPFMNFTGHYGAILSLRSTDTARGKSSVIRVSQSMWGSPSKILALDATAVAVDIQLGLLQHLPIFWDEAGSSDNTKTFMSTLFKLGQGKSKSRGHRSGQKLLEIRTWATSMTVGTNFSIAKAAEGMGGRSEAGVARVLELEVTKRLADRKVENFDGIIRELDHNYGWAGAAVSEWLGSRASSLADRVQSYQHDLSREFGAEDADRFMIALITCIELGAAVGNKVGVSRFDVDALHAYLKSEFMRIKRTLLERPVGTNKAYFQVDLISAFLNDRDTTKLRTNAFARLAPGRPAEIQIIGIPPEERFAKSLTAQITKDKVRISRVALMEHIRKRQLHLDSSIIDEMIKTLGAVPVRATLGSGTKMFKGQAQEHLLELDLTRPELQNLFDED